MELADILRARRTVRRYTDEDIPEDLLRRVLGAAVAMPHSGNTYDWRAIVLRRPRRTHPRWDEIFDALLRQEYVAEAPILVVWTVQPGWWLEHYRANLDELVRDGLIEPSRSGRLLDTMSAPRISRAWRRRS